jgi:tetratricopeptide (TPR) repeat protein
MPKRQKHKHQHQRAKALPPTVAGLGVEGWRAHVQTLLARGQTREAVEAAKEFLKQVPSAEAEALVVEAYQARIQALIASGMYKEAGALAALVSERFPASQARVAPFIRQSEVASGNFEALLTELSYAAPPRRRELEAILTQAMHDPAVLADSTALPADHPLKRMAIAVRELFSAVTSGPLPEGVLAALDDIPRHSPLAPWKLLIRALDAFYRHADASVSANLDGIPLDSGPGRLVPVLRRLIGETKPTEQRSVAVTTLLDKVSGGRTLLQGHLTRLTHALTGRDVRTALAAVQAVLPQFESSPSALRRTLLATLLHHWHRADLPPPALLRVLPRSKRDPDILRLIALTIERTDWSDALALWDEYVTAAIETGILPATGPEISRVLLHMAGLFPEDAEDVWDVFDVESEEALQQVIRAGQLPACFDRGALLERARRADPAPQVFRALVAHYDRRQPKRAEAEAEAWRRAHSQDLEPLLYLIRAAEGRGALRKALAFLAEAESINRVHPEVRQTRFRLLLAGAERRIKEGKRALALTDLDRLEQEPRAAEGDHRAYLVALRWAVARRAADAPSVAQCEQTLRTSVGNPALHDLILGTVAASFGIEASKPLATPSQAEAIEALARGCDLFHALNRPLIVPPVLLAQVEKGLHNASVAQLHALCMGGLRIGQPALTYAASTYGLAQDGSLMHRFLLARGQALQAATSFEERERARQCLRVARELAARVRDMDAVREASAALQTLPAGIGLNPWMWDSPPLSEVPATQEEIQRTIDAERQRRATPAFSRAREPRQRRRRMPVRRQSMRDLFEDLYPWMEGKR